LIGFRPIGKILQPYPVLLNVALLRGIYAHLKFKIKKQNLISMVPNEYVLLFLHPIALHLLYTLKFYIPMKKKKFSILGKKKKLTYYYLILTAVGFLHLSG